MILNKLNKYKKISQCSFLTNRFKKRQLGYLSFLLFFFTACTDFVEVDLPKNQLAAEAVFEDVATANATLKSMYGKMRDNGLLTGIFGGLNDLMGLYTDELDYYGSNQSLSQSQFYNHLLLSSDAAAANWWNTGYNIIYAANAVIFGVENSSSLSIENQDQLKGEALFIRAYLHFLLVELYGGIPYIKTTDYLENTSVARMPVSEVYEHIKEDLVLAANLLPNEDVSGEQTRPYSAVANALLARIYLYTQQWDAAEAAANKVINQTGTYQWEPDLNNVFLRNASSTLWQFKPETEGFNTHEGSTFIFEITPPSIIALTNNLVGVFETDDLRRSLWVKEVSDGTDIWYHAFKYKEKDNIGASVEYSILFRLAELYLIRAEARAQLGDINGAQQDLNLIRTRAGLGDTMATTVDDLLIAVLEERRVELFTEFGHRWFDLKRTGKAADVLAPIKPGWQATDILLPIPDAELLVNPNLLPQNAGY